MDSPLRRPGVRPYIAGRLASSLGRSMLATALGWQLYERTGSALALGMIGLVQVVPVVGFALRAGSAADRGSRRRIGGIWNGVNALVALGLAGLSHAHGPIWAFYALLFVNGVATAFASPATSSLLPALVPPLELPRVNAWTSTVFQLAGTAGPALAGFAIAWTGDATVVYAAQAVFAAVFAAIVWRLPVSDVPAVTTAERPRDRWHGVHFVFRVQVLLGAITLDLFAVLLGGVTALLPIYAKDLLHVGPVGLGWLQAASSIGAFSMAFLQTRIGPWQRSGFVLLTSVAGFGAATIGFALSRSFALSLFLLFLTGVFDSMSVVIRRTLEQVVTPDHLRGRVSAVHWVFIGLSNELGELESGVAAWLIGPVAAAALGGAGTLIVVALAAWRWPELRRLRRLGDLRERTDVADALTG